MFIIEFLLHMHVQTFYWKTLLISIRLLRIWISAVNIELTVSIYRKKNIGDIFPYFPVESSLSILMGFLDTFPSC